MGTDWSSSASVLGEQVVQVCHLRSPPNVGQPCPFPWDQTRIEAGTEIAGRSQSHAPTDPYLAANDERRCLPLTRTATPIRRSPQTPCSIFIHSGKVPGRAMMTTMAAGITIEMIRSRR